MLGAQSIKVGYQGGFLVSDQKNFTNNQNLAFRFDNGVPNQLTQLLLPFQIAQRTRYDAVYAQDQWTRRRLTLQGAPIRPRGAGFPSQIGPLASSQARSRCRNKGVDSYMDISPRMGAACDLVGGRRTSIRGEPQDISRWARGFIRERGRPRGSRRPRDAGPTGTATSCPTATLSPLSNGGLARPRISTGKPVFSNTAIRAPVGLGAANRTGASARRCEGLPSRVGEVGYFRR